MEDTTIFDLSLAPMIKIDINDLSLYAVNDAICDLLGYTKEELLNMKLNDIVIDNNIEYAINRHRQGNKVEKHFNIYLTKDGTRKYLEWNGSPPDEQGIVTGIAKDITKERQYQVDMDRFFNLTPDLMAVADTNGYFVKVNDKWVNETGYTEEELTTTPFISFVFENDKRYTIKTFKALIQGKGLSNFFNRYIKKSGEILALEWSASHDPNEKLVYATARILTNEKHLTDIKGRVADVLEELRKAKIQNDT